MKIMPPQLTPTYLLLARCEAGVLATVEANIAQHYEYEKLSAKAFWFEGEFEHKDVLKKIMNGVGLEEKIYLYSLDHPDTPSDLHN